MGRGAWERRPACRRFGPCQLRPSAARPTRRAWEVEPFETLRAPCSVLGGTPTRRPPRVPRRRSGGGWWGAPTARSAPGQRTPRGGGIRGSRAPSLPSSAHHRKRGPCGSPSPSAAARARGPGQRARPMRRRRGGRCIKRAGAGARAGVDAAERRHGGLALQGGPVPRDDEARPVIKAYALALCQHCELHRAPGSTDFTRWMLASRRSIEDESR